MAENQEQKDLAAAAALLRSMREMEQLSDEEEIEVLLPDGMEPEADPQGRRVRCPAHGLEYDSTQAGGCGLCQREKAAQQKTSQKLRGGHYMLAGLLGLGLLALSLRLFGSGEPIKEISDDEALVKGPAGNLTLDPSPYREQIEALEAVLYKGPPEAITESGFLERSAKDLAEEIRFSGKAALRHPLADRIAYWGTTVAAAADASSGMVELGFARTQWEALRAEVFLPADWFASADPRPTEAPSSGQPSAPATAAPGGPPASVTDTVAALRSVADALHGLIAEGWKEVEAFEDGAELEEGSAEALELAGRWFLWTRTWNERLQKIQAGMPRQPDSDVAMDLILAQQEIETALRQLGQMAAAGSKTSIPPLKERQGHLHLASQSLEEAKVSLKKL